MWKWKIEEDVIKAILKLCFVLNWSHKRLKLLESVLQALQNVFYKLQTSDQAISLAVRRPGCQAVNCRELMKPSAQKVFKIL